MSPEFAAEVTHSKCWGVLTHSPTPIKNASFCSIFFDLSKPTQSLVITGLNHYFIPAIYPLSINTRITRENCAKNNHNFNPPKQAPPNSLPQPFPHTRSPKQGIKTKPCLTGGWPHFVKPSTPHKFFNRWCRQSLNRNPKGDPHDLAFDEINSRRWHHAFNGL